MKDDIYPPITKKLYFVEEIESIHNPHTGKEEERIAVLLYIPENIHNWIDNNQDFRRFIKQPITNIPNDLLREGNYVYLYSNNEYESGSNDLRVQQISLRSNELVERLYDNIIEGETALDPQTFNNISCINSYHVNVGHGNHSLIVFRSYTGVHIWMVDCSDYDFTSHRYYRNNIDSCLNHIQLKFGLNHQPHIDVVMLTHPHYDHYSGINYYIKKNYIDKDTIFYINLKCKFPIHNFNNLLNNIFKMGAKIVEPFCHNSSRNIRIIYPDIKKFSNKLSINNQSSVFNIVFNDTSYFVFPGDLEKDGWDLLGDNCKYYMKKTLYYAISHHGSINGHLRSCILRDTVGCITDCLYSFAVPVLMGRDKAFNGIYSNRVLNDFNGRIYYSEKNNDNIPAKFLEIDLLYVTRTWY